MKRKKQIAALGIRNKIFACFLIPVIFMIFVGIIAYNKAQAGMSDNYETSSLKTIQMGVEYLDVVYSNIQSDGMTYAFDANYDTYFLGGIKESFKVANFHSTAKASLAAAQSTNSFINNIHMIANPGIPTISTASSEKPDGIMDKYKEEAVANSSNGNVMDKWTDSHSILDESVGIDPASYFMAFQSLSNKRDFVVVIDISNDAIQDFLNGIDLGTGSATALISPSGKQITSAQSVAVDFATLDAYKAAVASEDATSGSSEISYNGSKYLFLYSKSEVSGVVLCSIIPVSFITGQAESIKSITATLVLLATLICVLIGLYVTYGIQKNMKKISEKMNEVADGNLSVEVEATGHDEFQSLAGTATNMINNNRKLIRSVINTVDQLESSVENVYDVSNDINQHSSDITNAIEEIGTGMEKQADHAQECILLTNNLSNKIQNIIELIQGVQSLADSTEAKIREGINIVNDLGAQAASTSEITGEVGQSVVLLKEESAAITGFADIIQNISDQTNLLSLNASIEAARAGEAGRGFSVVAEEISKLADESAAAAKEIKRQVEVIGTKTGETVRSTEYAQQMVEKEAEAVTEVTRIFSEMNTQISQLFAGLNEIANDAENTSSDRTATLEAVENISAIIEETSSSASLVGDMADRLQENVSKLADTADVLDVDMNNLRTEMSAFKLE